VTWHLWSPPVEELLQQQQQQLERLKFKTCWQQLPRRQWQQQQQVMAAAPLSQWPLHCWLLLLP
jgi:hypothetical protein